jgi:L-amino acid N-acyltransferase YncA
MITAQVESFEDRLDELRPLLPAHHAELGLFQDRMPLDPQFDLYVERERLGQLLFVTVREDGALVGYWISFIAPGLHYRQTITNTMDIYWVHPDHRGHGAGFMLADLVKAESVKRGVKVWYAGSKNHKPSEWFFKRLGFVACDSYFVMWIGEE